MLVVVTGASQGIGAALAEAFAGEPGARLALLSRNAERLREVAERCDRAGAVAEAFPCDVTRDDQVASTAEAILKRAGPPHVLVNNAGRFMPGELLATTPEAFRGQVEVNLTSAFLVTRAFLPAMIEAGRGRVVFLASVASLRAYPGGGAYCAAKHGLLGLARAFREETRETGVGVTAVMPGATFTPSWEGAPFPEERFMPAGEIARVIVDACRLGARTVVEEIVLRPQLGDL